MKARRGLEWVVGGGLLLGPLVYALSLSAPSGEGLECGALVVRERVVAMAVPVPVPVPVPVVEPKPEPEPVPEPEPKVESAPELPGSPPDPATLLLVEDGYLVLAAEVEAGWGEGELYAPEVGEEFTAAKRVRAERVPAELRALGGLRYDLYDADGKTCTATVGELEILARYAGFGVEDLFEDRYYEDDDDDGIFRPIEDVVEPSVTEIRDKVWATQDKLLVARLELGPSCGRPLWARDADLPPPVVLTRAPEPSAVAEARLASFLESEAMAALELEYEAWRRAPGNSDEPSWAERTAGDEPRAQSWVDDQGRDRVLGLDSGGGDSCVNFVTHLTRVEELVDGSFVDGDRPPWPDAVFDADLDGQLEYLYRDWDASGRNARVLSQTPQLQRSLRVLQDFYCPC